MIRQPHTATREMIVAKAMEEVAAELRMVDVADYVAFMRLEHYATIADIVDSASELYYQPGTLSFGHGGEAVIGWSGDPEIILDMQFRPHGATVYFTLKLTDATASVEVNYVSFDNALDDPEENSRFLETALAGSRIMKRRPHAASERSATAG
jgi:hypothetical protein